jgi:transcriptional regulator GlxA family with amidase domain
MRAKNDNKLISIGIFNPPGSMESAVTGMKEIFELLNVYSGKRFYEVTIIKNQSLDFDFIVIPPLLHDPFKPRENLIKNLEKINLKRSVVCSVCSGAFQLGYANIIGGRRVTTHWGYLKEFKSRFPKVKVDINEMIVEDGPLVTAAGIMAYIDLCLYIIKKSLSLEMAQRCAKIILFNGHREKQSPYMDQTLLSKKNEQENELLEWIENNITKEFTIELMATQLGMHERTFLRWFKAHFNSTPLKFINSVRLEKAKSLLLTTDLTVSEICYEVGHLDVSTFRKNFKKLTGISPSAFRAAL